MNNSTLSYFIRLATIFDAMPDALIIINGHGNIGFTNKQVENLFGYTRASLQNQRVEKLIAPRFHTAHANYQKSYFSSPHARPAKSGFDLMALRQDGTEFPIEISFTTLETDEEIVVLEIIRDISKQKELEHELSKKNEELKIINGGTNFLLSNINVILDLAKSEQSTNG